MESTLAKEKDVNSVSTFEDSTDSLMARILLTLEQDGTEAIKRHRLAVFMAGIACHLVDMDVLIDADVNELLADCLK